MKTIGVIFGGCSYEHDVSVLSGLSVINNLDKNKYLVKQIYISKKGEWYEHKNGTVANEIKQATEEIQKNLKKIENVIEYLKAVDIIFPVLHGKNGEDGTIQGLFEIIEKNYIGCGVLASSVGMDKAYAKVIFAKANIPQANYAYIREYKGNYIYVDNNFNEEIFTLNEITEKLGEDIKFPIFVKPSNSGSSVGINKSHNIEELKEHIVFASKYDRKIVLEESITGRELECAVLGNEDVKASGVGEILPADEFYSFSAKYINAETKTVTSADIPREVKEEIQRLAIKAFKAIDGKGLARIDFFWDETNNKIYINEINTLPGFTQISMYSKLWEDAGISYSELLEKLILLSQEQNRTGHFCAEGL